MQKNAQRRLVHSPGVQKEILQLDEQHAFNALHKKLSAEIHQFQLTAPKCMLTHTTVKGDLIEFCTASVPFCVKI